MTRRFLEDKKTDKFGKTFIGAVLIGLFVLTSGAASADWKADCAALIKELEIRAGMMKQAGMIKVKIMEHLEKAEKAIKKGNRKKCEKHTAKADEKLIRKGN